MSGFKRATVRISEEEYRRLHEADMKRRFRGHTQKKSKKAAKSTSTGFNETLQQIERRQQELEQALQELDPGYNQVEAQALQDILQQNSLCYESLSAVIAENTSNADHSLELISQRFSEQLQQERENYHQRIDSLSQRLETYSQKEQFRETAARQWLRQAVVLADFIQVQFEHERFLPGRLLRIRKTLELAQQDLAQGIPEATIQIAQQAYLELSELHLELEQLLVEWQAEYEKAQNIIQDMIAELEQNVTVKAIGLEGEELKEEVDLTYWTDGKYQRFLENARQFPIRLEKERTQITTEELKHISKEFPETVTATLESYIFAARLNALNSQLRMNIAETALEALEQHGFRLNESGYIDRDHRAPFFVHLQNMDGTRVQIQVNPTKQEEQELANELVVITNHPYLKTEHEARQQWEELCRSLNDFDLQVSRPEIRVAPPLTLPDAGEQSPLVVKKSIGSKRHHNV